MNTAHRCIMGGVAYGGLLLLALSAVPAPGQEPLTVEPPLSRLYGSDDLDFGGLFVSGAISPDGRWLVFSRARTEDAGRDALGLGVDGMNLWIAPMDGSRRPERLTDGAYWDAGPVWFPSGDRIAFRSTRADPEGHLQFLMTLDVDPSVGRAASVPRQISLEPVVFNLSYGVSPDGREIVYVPHPDRESREEFALKVIPSTGGTARTLLRQPNAILAPDWSEDGYIYFVGHLAAPPDDALESREAVRRVPATGGEAETLSTCPDIHRLSAKARTVLYRITSRASSTATYEVATLEGRRLARFTLPENMKLETCFVRGVAECLGTTEDVVSAIKILPVEGGPVRQITERRGTNHAMGWTADGTQVILGTEVDGTRMLMSAPSQGGVLRELYRQPPEDWVYGPSVMDGRYVLYGVEDDSDGALVLKIVDVRTGSVREITRTPWSSYTAYHASQSRDRFLYAERRDGRFEFRAVHPEGESVLLRAFPDTTFPPIVGVHGDRIAWWTTSEGRSTLYVARSGAGQAREILTLPGRIGQRGSSPPTWSPDGRFLITGYYPDETEDALLVEIDEQGNAVGEPRVVGELPESWWSPGWLPDGSGFLVVGGDVWLAPVDGSPTVNLTEDEPGMIWSYALSPDGRHVAIAPEVRRGASIWRIDLEAVLRREAPEGEGGGGGS